MQKVSISVIVPVYNVSSYLRQCVDSILAQSFENYELILVDDGSTDESSFICDEYAECDNRIKVIHQQNAGAMKARIAGLGVAEGDFLAFIDSDDWLEPNHLECLYDAIEQGDYDIAQCGFFIYDGKIETGYSRKLADSVRQVVLDCLNGVNHAGLWRKLIKRSFWEQTVKVYPPYTYYEDRFITVSLFMGNPQYVYSPTKTYHYRVNPDSLTNDVRLGMRCKMYMEMVVNMQELDKLYSLSADNDMRKALYKVVNDNKRRIVYLTSTKPEWMKPMLEHFRYSYSFWSIRNMFDLMYWLSSRFGLTWHWEVRKWIKCSLLWTK